MTDQLEPFRRIVRSMRFVPPLRRTHLTQEQVTSQPPINSWASSIKANEVIPAPVSPFNHYEHVAALVREAVAKPTVLPVAYTILENIGDRISRLSPTKSITPFIIQPKIPQPDPNWIPTPSVELKHTEFEREVQLEETPNREVEASAENLSSTQGVQLPHEISDTDIPTARTEIEITSAEILLPSAPHPTEVSVADVVEQEAISLPTAEPEDIQKQLKPVIESDSEALSNNLLDAQNAIAATVEPTKSLLEAADKEEKIQIQCPKCESSKIWKSGHYKGKQRYACKDCGKRFVLPEPVAENTDSQTNVNSISNQSEVKALQANDDIAANSQKVSKSRYKGKAKGFGDRKTK